MAREQNDPYAGWWDKDLEHVVTAQILMNDTFCAGAYDAYVAVGIEPKHFHVLRNRLIWEEAAALAEAGQLVELTAIARELHRAGHAADASKTDLMRMTDGVPCWGRGADMNERRAYFRANAERLHELWSIRETGHGLQRVATELRGTSPETGELRAELARMNERLHQPLFADDGGADSVFSAAMMSAGLEQPGAVLGLETIDECFGGIRAGQVCLVQARSGVGKTQVLCRSAFHTQRDIGWGVIFFSMEQPTAEIFERFYRIATGLNRHEYALVKQQQGLDPDTWRVTCPRLLLYDGPRSIDEIERLIVRAQHDTFVDAPGVLVIIDYFTLIRGDERLSSYERLSKFAREIKQLAKRRHVAMEIAVQVGRDAGGDGSVLLSLGSARDSGQIEECADLMVGLRHLDTPSATDDIKTKYKATIFAHIMKHKNGELLPREIAYRIDWRGYQLNEDPHLHPPEVEGNMASMGRRRR